MDIGGSHRARRRWLAGTLLFGSAAALLVALIGDDQATTRAAMLFVLSAMLLAGLGRRADRGNSPSRAVWHASVAATVLAAVALVYLADSAVVAFAVMAVAVVFTLLVVLFAVLMAITSEMIRPEWMLDEDGRLFGIRDRMRAAARRVHEHPGRDPDRIYRQLLRDTTSTTWRAPSGRRVSFSHLRVALHPDTLRILDEWMPVEDLAADLAHAYADARDGGRRKSALAVVLVSSDPVVPVGVGSVHGSFREDTSGELQARAWAKLRGPKEIRGDGEKRRIVVPSTDQKRRTASLQPSDGIAMEDDPTLRLLLDDGDRTRILPDDRAIGSRPDIPSAPMKEVSTVGTSPAGHGAPNAVLTRTSPRNTILVLRRCRPGGEQVPGATEHLLDPSRPWTLGRANWADVRFDEHQVSREHLHLIPGDGEWMAVDRSTLGTTVNGRALEKHIPAPIRAGDVLELGDPPEGGDRVLLLVA